MATIQITLSDTALARLADALANQPNKAGQVWDPGGTETKATHVREAHAVILARIVKTYEAGLSDPDLNTIQ